MKLSPTSSVLLAFVVAPSAVAMVPPTTSGNAVNRRAALGSMVGGAGWALVQQEAALADAPPDGGMPDRFDVDSYLKSGYVQNPMGVSGQAGKSRPETGV